ncbi:MBL fold metallo-hydrolase [Ferrovibrio sp.]|uniref:MBL fold metallo-hydrolase n=1 Tax=Ferrovibrio sp. TaxID=1917215 RepID=UPI001B75B100|nr:MBL fold metallo-hydrolase [Ferrovibrio sp.]MBP7063477.1 MBL fold metallo-hydrolase [Ferrovibrio sp.]
MPLHISAHFHEPTNTVSYLVWDSATNRAAVIDPVLDFDAKSGRTGTQSIDALLAEAAKRSLSIDWTLETHAHADHLSAAPVVRQRSGARSVIGADITKVQKVFKPIFDAGDLTPDGSAFDRLLQDGESLPLGSLRIEAMATPGHTPACMSYRIEDAVFVGDTLFMPDYGTARCDFPGGDAATLYRSIQRLLCLPPETRLFLCHDYKAPGRDQYVWETTVAAQKAGNLHVRDGIDEASFVAMRQARDAKLDMPALILPSVQVNIRAGDFPPAAENGTVYLKLPVNLL